MTIDERLEFLAKNIESLHATQHERVEENARRDERSARLDKRQARIEARESQARMAILEGIKRYLEVLQEGTDDAEETPSN